MTPAVPFHLHAVTLQPIPGLEHTVCHGFPTLSALGDKPWRGPAGLRAKVREVLESADAGGRMNLHRRVTGADPVMRQAGLTLRPGAKFPEWREPVELSFDWIEWREDDTHFGFVPALGVLVFAGKAELLPARVIAHVRLVLVDAVKRVSLRDLAASQRARVLRLEDIAVSAKLKSPRQVEEEDAADGETKSVLKEVAVKWTRANTNEAFELEETVALMREVLASRLPGSVLLVGPPGVGKTAAVRQLARDGPLEIRSTSGSRLIAGQSGFGQWQERCRELCRELAASRAILHLGNLCELMEVGRHAANAQSIASFLRPWIARGEILTIAECSAEQLAVIERTEPQLAAAFAEVRVPEPGAARTRRIIGRVFVRETGATDPAASAAALDWLHRLHLRYATYSANPGRALRFLTHLTTEDAADALTVPRVTAAFTRETGLPAVLLDDALPLDPAATREWFARRVIGQDEAVEAVVNLLATIKARLNRPRQPLASLLFAGPTGTGKTELAKSLAEFLFGSAKRLCRIDLSEFADPLAVARLTGGATGGEGLLTARVRAQPFGVILLDEFEKADPSFFDLLLQILGDGRLTDAAGRVADFRNTVIIMTSNLGAREFQRGRLGFGADDGGAADFHAATRSFLRPEIYNRLGAVIGFRPLGADLMRHITRRHLALIGGRDGLRLRGVELRLGDGVEDYLARRGHDPKYGARPLKRVLEAELVTPLAEALNPLRPGTPLLATVSLAPAGLAIAITPRDDKHGAAAARRAGEIAVMVTERRRTISAFARGEAMTALDNEIPVLAVFERLRLHGLTLDHPTAANIARLRELRRVTREGRELAATAGLLETEVLTVFHGGGRPDETRTRADAGQLATAFAALRRTVFRLGFASPDDIVLALYGGSREWTLQLAATYLQDAADGGGVLRACEFVLPPTGRATGEVPPIRVAADDLTNPLSSPRGGWLGILLHLRGELLFPRLADEAGLHQLTGKGATRLCLIETQAPGEKGLAGYVPPAGIHRAGSVSAKGLQPRRQFATDQLKGVDARMGDFVFSRGDTGAATRNLVDAWLELQIEELA